MSPRFDFPYPDGWFVIGYSEELPPGEVRSLHYFGRELVMFRDGNAEARVLDAHCPHLGAHLGKGGEIVDGRLRCPFHHWEVDGDGICRNVPYAKHIPPKAKTGSWRVHEYCGLILLHHDKQGRSPTIVLPEIPEFGSEGWTEPLRREWIIKSTAQELAENAVIIGIRVTRVGTYIATCFSIRGQTIFIVICVRSVINQCIV